MKRFSSLLLLLFVLFTYSCSRNISIISKMKNIIIFTEYGFSGSSYELIHENNNVVILEKIYKSGLNEYYSTKYSIETISKYDIKFHQIIETDNPNKPLENNQFSIQLGKNNDFELIVNNKMYLETSRKRK